MNPLRKDDIERAKRTPPGEKLEEAFEMIRFGFDMYWETLCRRHPDETAEQLEQRFTRWLRGEAR